MKSIKTYILRLAFTLMVTALIFGCSETSVEPSNTIKSDVEKQQLAKNTSVESIKAIKNTAEDSQGGDRKVKKGVRKDVKKGVKKDVTIEFDLTITGPNSAQGTFSSTGATRDFGSASETFNLFPVDAPPTKVKGIKTLNGRKGQIVIEFQANIDPATNVAEGKFTMVSGTGGYKNIVGKGTTKVTINVGSGKISGKYEGKMARVVN